MKRIFLLFFLLMTIYCFPQSEIWGIKQQAGKHNGGFLYSIDSATNKIIEHQYFANPKADSRKSGILYDSTTKCMFGACNQILYKYDLVNRTIESKILEEEVYGSFVKASNGNLYILSKNGLIKVNPRDLSMELVGQFYGQFILPDSTMFFETEVGTSYGLCEVSEDHYIVANYTEDNSYHWKHTFLHSINTATDSIELIYRTSFYPENESLIPLGNFYPHNGLLYALFSMNGEIGLYSLNPLNLEFSNVHVFDELRAYQNTLPYIISSQGKIYVKTRNTSGNQTLLCECVIDTEEFKILSEIPLNFNHNRMITDENNDLYLLLDISEDWLIKTAFYQYNFETSQLDSLFFISERYFNTSIYDEFGSLVLFNNGIISFLDNNQDLDYQIVSYNTDQLKIDTIAYLQNSFNFTDSLILPASFCEAENGNLMLLNNRKIRMLSWYYKYFFSFTEYNPQTKELIRSDELELSSYCENPQIYKMSDEEYCITCNQDSVILKYHWSENEITNIETPFSAEWIKEKDNSFIGTSEDTTIYRFNYHSEQFEKLYKPDSDTSFDLACIDKENRLFIYSESIEQFLCLDLNTNEISSVNQLNALIEQVNYYRIEKVFSEGAYLFFVVYISSPYAYKLFRYHLPSHEFKLINIEENEDLSFFQFIENYTNDGIFIASLDIDNNTSGYLQSLANNSDSSIMLDAFENKTSAYENVYESYLRLIKTKKKPIHRWIGGLSEDWYESGNWSNASLPTEGSSVNIMNNAMFYPVIDSTIKIRNLYIYNDAKILLEKKAEMMVSDVLKNHGTINMTANNHQRSSLIVEGEFIQKGVQKYIFTADSINSKILASPMRAVEKYVQPSYSEAAFNETNFAFSGIQFYPHFSETCQALQYTCQDTLLEFKGSFNHGKQNLRIPILSEPELYPLSNPYPSSFNWNKTQTTTLTHQACYFFNEEENTISATVDGIGNHPPFIRPLEVFWVYGNGEESIQIDQSALMHEQDFEEEIPNRKVLSLQVCGAKKTSETLIAFNDLASPDYDPQLDAFKFIKNESYPHIFTKSDDELLMINQHPDTTMMNLFVQMGTDGNMNIKLSENHGFDFLVLEDLIWHTRTDLLEDDYQFDYFTSDGYYPFKLYFKSWVLEPLEEADIQMYYYPEYLVVKSRKQVKQADIIFYDLAGRVVLEFSEQNFFYIEKPIQIPAGHYIVQLRSGDLVINEKVLVR
ncbi:T9SS type A sorting domain-containing protein [Lentimicrobium sp. L6]|uniref:T9SS type A sorting domain-containing protein n=1 Tax=Lentimicrobium sp. L6 TaxID=2735916 RepID=UPI0015536619|nr:T9SS type A sorting domain-containing protein [Lentimicrobium sp. L6]NPD85916.1 T9SS type A sorting domain-containing protein [Lentimicrobium sp. L6]